MLVPALKSLQLAGEWGVQGESPLSWFSSARSTTARRYWVSLMGQFLQRRSTATSLQRGYTATGDPCGRSFPLAPGSL